MESETLYYSLLRIRLRLKRQAEPEMPAPSTALVRALTIPIGRRAGGVAGRSDRGEASLLLIGQCSVEVIKRRLDGSHRFQHRGKPSLYGLQAAGRGGGIVLGTTLVQMLDRAVRRGLGAVEFGAFLLVEGQGRVV